jgi:XTP/dITP diphosphohydrolase
MRLSNKIVLASMNPEKFREFSALLASYPDVELVPAEGLIRNPEKLGFVENHDNYLDNAAAKSRLANQGSHYPALSDDTGLEVDALGGKPGVHTQRFAQLPPGAPRSRSAQDRANLEHLLAELKKHPGVPRSARFVTVVTLLIEGILLHATGTLEGTIVESPRGTHGFGYDPVFQPKGSNKTLAEMTDGEKNSISHRAKALHELMAQAKARGIVFAKP